MLIILYVFEQLSRAPCQQDAHPLQLTIPSGDSLLLPSRLPLLLLLYFSQGVSHGVSDVHPVVHRVGSSPFLHPCHPHRIGMLSAESVAEPSEESLFRLHYFIHRLPLVVLFRRSRMNHHRVTSAVQCLHLVAVENVAAVLSQFRHHEHRVLAFGFQQNHESVESL